MGIPPQDKEPFPWMTEDNKQPVVLKNSSPNPKLAVGTLGGPSIALLIQWLLGNAGVDVPSDVALAMAALLGLVMGYYTPGRIS